MARDGSTWTWKQMVIKSDLKATTKHVLLTLDSYINSMGEGAYPSTKTLATDTSLSERAVCTHLQLAREAGFIRVKKHGFGAQKWARHEYFATYPPKQGTEPNDKVVDLAQKGTEPRSVPSAKKALNLLPKALNLLPKGTEPNDIKALNEVQSINPVNNPVNSVRGVELDFEVNRTVYFGRRKISFRQVLIDEEYIQLNSDSRVAAQKRAVRINYPQPDHWQMVDEYFAVSSIRQRAGDLGLINWFESLAEMAIENMRWATDGYQPADVDEVICKSGFAQLMTAFEAVQADDAA